MINSRGSHELKKLNLHVAWTQATIGVKISLKINKKNEMWTV